MIREIYKGCYEYKPEDKKMKKDDHVKKPLLSLKKDEKKQEPLFLLPVYPVHDEFLCPLKTKILQFFFGLSAEEKEYTRKIRKIGKF